MAKGLRHKLELKPLAATPPKRHWQWFWKSNKANHSYELWSEVIAYHLHALTNVAVPLCYPSFYDGQWGVLVRSFLQKNDELRHGGDVLSVHDPDYDRELGKQMTIQLIYEYFEAFNLRHRRRFFRIIAFDALIGNQDRHQENWALIAKPVPSGGGTISLAPAFDNGASLMRELRNDDELETKVGTDLLMEAYARRGKTEVRWRDVLIDEHLSHFEFVRRHVAVYPSSKKVVRDVLEYDDYDADAVVDRVARLSQECKGVELSDYRADRLKRLLRLRKAILLDSL